MANNGMIDHWAALEVERGADQATIKKSYRKLVLKYHPDKHPDDREVAETKIREINSAYEMLSNPAKRAAYEAQTNAVEKKQSGVRLDTSGIRPRMSIPKEFMMNPVGHPDKFVRACGSSNRVSAFVHNREDAKNVPFREFFEAARFTLWWVPQGANNCCRVKWHPGDGGSSTYVGNNMHFELSHDRSVSESTIMLNPGEDQFTSNVIVVASPDFAGAFRFEAAHFPGHYLAFKAPSHLRMVGSREDERSTILDFFLADYNSAAQYMTVEEVLIPVVQNLGGDKGYVPLAKLQEDVSVQRYFQRTLGQTVWQYEDFATYFEGHWDRWDFDIRTNSVRVRGTEEKIGYALQCAKTPDDAASVIANAGDDIKDMALDKVEYALRILTNLNTNDASGGVTAMVNRLTAQRRMLQQTLRKVAITGGDDVSLLRLLSMGETLTNFGGPTASNEIVQLRNETRKAVARRVSDFLQESPDMVLEFRALSELLRIDVDWKKCGSAVARQCHEAVEAQPLDRLVPVLREAVAAKAGVFAEFLAAAVMERLQGAGASAVAEALEAVASGGFNLEGVARQLHGIFRQVTAAQGASLVAAVGEHGGEGDYLKSCAEALEERELAFLPPALLVRLSVAAAKSVAVAEGALGVTCKGATASMGSVEWSLDDVSKLLLAASKPKGGASAAMAASEALFARAAEVLTPQLSAMSALQLIKIVFAIAKVPTLACRSLLDAAAIEATRRLSDIARPQLILLTQGLLPLGPGNRSLCQLLDFWAQSFTEPSDNDKAKAELGADQVVKLLAMLAPVAPDHDIFEAAAGRLLNAGAMRSLTEAGLTTLQGALAQKGAPSFRSREKLLQEAKRAVSGEKNRRSPSSSADQRKKRSRSRSKRRRH